MESELSFTLRPYKRSAEKFIGGVLQAVFFIPFVIIKFVLILLCFIFHPIQTYEDWKLMIWHKYLKRWRNTWRFMRGKYEGEFDPIFDLDGLAMAMMSPRQLARYQHQIVRRRHYVHEKTL
ncbi:MAG: hypothetical protein KBC48_00455 [Candidatus Pacebacteria bacterium]|nr:hypothetical protein [Candidatus Paceibacterota bacterium]